MLTPHRLYDEMIDQLRSAVIADQARRRRTRLRLWSRRVVVSLRIRPRGELILGVTALLLLTGAGVIFALHWPPGGGSEESALAYTVGATLIFVVILLSFVSGSVQAGQALGWDSGWVARDRVVWGGFLALALLSLFEIWIGYVKPERPEEGAVIILTAAGLATTAMVARRLIFLSDPINQLASRMESMLPRLRKLVQQGQAGTVAATKGADLSSELASRVQLYPTSAIQEGFSRLLRQLRATCQRAISAGSWDLATASHRAMTQTVRAYAEAVGALHSDDGTVQTYCFASNDLHQLADGPGGRDFSRSVVWSLREAGLAVADRQRTAGVLDPFNRTTDPGPLFSFIFFLKEMLMRRLTDDNAEDSPLAITCIGDLTVAALQMGDSSLPLSAPKDIHQYAIAGSVARKPHIADPAWKQALRILFAITAEAEKHDRILFTGAAGDFERALRELPAMPGLFSGFDRITGVSMDRISLTELAYTIALSESIKTSEFDDWSLGIVRALAQLVPKTKDSHERRAGSKSAGEVLHHFNLAAAMRADTHGFEEAIGDLVGNQLSWHRGLFLREGSVLEDSAVDELWHAYLSGLLVALYVTREASSLPPGLRQEVERFLTALTPKTMAEMPGNLSEGLQRLATGLELAGATDLAERTLKLADDPGMPVAPLDERAWGLTGGFFIYRGQVVAAVAEHTERWLAEQP
jgi:hypothetical protein